MAKMLSGLLRGTTQGVAEVVLDPTFDLRPLASQAEVEVEWDDDEELDDDGEDEDEDDEDDEWEDEDDEWEDEGDWEEDLE